jgi:hypothetical protein
VTLPDNIREALEAELVGLEQRLARADDPQRDALRARMADIRRQLGLPPTEEPKVRRKAAGKETRPGDDTTEAR